MLNDCIWRTKWGVPLPLHLSMASLHQKNTSSHLQLQLPRSSIILTKLKYTQRSTELITDDYSDGGI
jgi:hypothetical protein